MTDNTSDSASTPDTSKNRTLPTLEVGLGTVIATAANQIQDHPGIQAVLTSAAPVLGVGLAFLSRLLAGLLIRWILANGAKKTYNEIAIEIKNTAVNRTSRIKELEKQLDEARQALITIRTQKIELYAIK